MEEVVLVRVFRNDFRLDDDDDDGDDVGCVAVVGGVSSTGIESSSSCGRRC